MNRKQLSGAALAAWFAASVAAQDPQAGQRPVAARRAAATLAEARGDIAAAQRELEAALANAAGSERAEVQQALAALRQRSGQSPSERQDPKQDPVRNLIAVLDTGSQNDAAVDAAVRQLQSLGSLAVPQLLDALPNASPFGNRNILSLVVPQDDARVIAALQKLIATADPAVAMGVAYWFGDMPRSTRLAIAGDLLSDRYPTSVRMLAFSALAELDDSDARLGKSAQQLVAVPEAQAKLLDDARGSRAAWSDAVVRALAERGAPEVRSRAVEIQLLRSDALTEEAALAALATLPETQRAVLAAKLVERNPAWVRVGIAALDPRVHAQLWGHPWFVNVEWRRGGDAAVEALLALPGDGLRTENVGQAIEQIVANGWRMPSRLEPAFERFARQNRWEMFVRALPDDAEDRALAVWQRSDRNDRLGLAWGAVSLDRPWHRLVVRQLEELRDPENWAGRMLRRSWHGAEEATIQRLAEIVTRWLALPTTAALDPSQRYTHSGNEWRAELCIAFDQGLLPSAVVLPLVRAHDQRAWTVLCSRDPARAMAEARSWQDISVIAHSVAIWLALHDDGSNLDLMIRAVVSINRVNANSTFDAPVIVYLQAHGAGAPAVIAFAKDPNLPTANRQLVDVAVDSARKARMLDLEELMSILPDLSHLAANSVLAALGPQLRPEHVTVVARALSASTDMALSPERRSQADAFGRIQPGALCITLLDTLAQIGADALLPEARRILARTDIDEDLAIAAARSALAVAKQGRSALIVELLADARPRVVQQAVMIEDLRDDAALRQKVTDAILRCGDRLESLDYTFLHLRPDDALALAKQLIEDARWSKFSVGVCSSVLRLLGDRKDAALAPTLALGARHREERVRQWTAEMLGYTFAKDAAPFLLELLKDENEDVRKQASASLDQIANYLDAKAKWQERLK